MNPMPKKFGFPVVSRVYLLTSPESLGLRQPHPARQVGEAGVGAEIVEFRVTFKDLRPHYIPSPQDVFEKHGRFALRLEILNHRRIALSFRYQKRQQSVVRRGLWAAQPIMVLKQNHDVAI